MVRICVFNAFLLIETQQHYAKECWYFTTTYVIQFMCSSYEKLVVRQRHDDAKVKFSLASSVYSYVPMFNANFNEMRAIFH